MSKPELVIELEDGGQVELLATDGDHVSLTSARAHPPGSTLRGTSPLGPLRIKIRGSTCTGACYRVEGRFVNLSRQQREALKAG
jgi:hypothetical protein